MRRWWRGPAVAVLVGGLTAGCGGGPPSGARAVSPQGFYVSDRTAAARQLAGLGGQDAALLHRITDRPSALWLGDGRSVGAQAEDYTRRAAAAGRIALLVAYDIPGRDCGQFSAGGAGDGAAYRAWVDALAAGIADRPAWVVLEPDAVAHAVSGCGTAPAEERYRLLADAVDRLKARPAVRVYLDAGNPGWVSDTGALAEALRRAGVDRADGFSVNVSNFYTTEQSAAYGGELSRALGGKHFVIDTSRNGRGSAGPDSWCNPPGRALGPAPTTETGRAGVDAYLWIKNPGESDGDCGRGEPAAGEFWLDYALGLASRA